MYPTHAGPIGCTMLVLWHHKYKVGHIGLILIKHQNLLNGPEIPEFSHVSHIYIPLKYVFICTLHIYPDHYDLYIFIY